MKVFLKYILRFSLGLILLNMVGSYILFLIYYKPYELPEDFSINNTFLLSDSHGAALGSLLKRGIGNFSASGDSYIDMERKLHYLIRNYKVERILLTVDNHTLSSYRDQLNNSNLSVIYVDPTSKDYPVETFPYLRDRYLTRYALPFNSKARIVLINYFIYRVFNKSYWRKIFKKQRRPKKNPNRKSNKPVWYDDPKLEEKLQHWADKQYDKQLSIEMRDALLRILETCQKNNIELIGIRFPISKEYSNLTGHLDFGAREVFEAKALRILDYNMIFSEHRDYFKDMDHVNEEGAAILSEMIGNDISSK